MKQPSSVSTGKIRIVIGWNVQNIYTQVTGLLNCYPENCNLYVHDDLGNTHTHLQHTHAHDMTLLYLILYGYSVVIVL